MANRFVELNNNPKNRRTSDCVIRALTLALGLDAKTVLNELTEIYFKTGWYVSDFKGYGKYLESKGFVKCAQPMRDNRTKYRGHEFCEFLDNDDSIKGTVVAHIGAGHIAAIVNTDGESGRHYVIHDTWDCSNRIVGTYWVRKE